jgi:hypothetical protein
MCALASRRVRRSRADTISRISAAFFALNFWSPNTQASRGGGSHRKAKMKAGILISIIVGGGGGALDIGGMNSV